MDPLSTDPSFHRRRVPSGSVSFYPTNHEGAGDILRLSGRAPISQTRTPPPSTKTIPNPNPMAPDSVRFLIGEDEAENWEDHIDPSQNQSPKMEVGAALMPQPWCGDTQIRQGNRRRRQSARPH